MPLTVASLFDGRKKPKTKSLPKQGSLWHLLRNLIAFCRFDEFKTAADELGLDHQVCKGHVTRNTETLIENLQSAVAADTDASLVTIGMTAEQAIADLTRLGKLIHSRQPEEEAALEEMHHRYIRATPPGAGEKATVAHRLRLLFLDRWNLWSRLTRYRTWQGPNDETLDGTSQWLRAGHWLVD